MSGYSIFAFTKKEEMNQDQFFHICCEILKKLEKNKKFIAKIVAINNFCVIITYRGKNRRKNLSEYLEQYSEYLENIRNSFPSSLVNTKKVILSGTI